MSKKIGILITNIGSPDHPTYPSVFSYLKKFLSDKRVIEIPKILWYPILYGIILPFRSAHSAKLYQKIWTKEGSPLTFLSQKLIKKLEQELKIPVALGMHYGNPSIKEALKNLKKHNIDSLIVIPLFPHYSATTTASTFDKVYETVSSWRHIPEFHFSPSYFSFPNYIEAITQSIKNTWEKQNKPDHLLFSFHSIPKQCTLQGDPYALQCYQTANLIAEKLQLKKNFWSVSFQSRLGRSEWLSPYTHQVLQKLPSMKVKNLHVICPGFSIDCLETLEEINMRGQKQFLQAGGENFYYIPALNDSHAQVNFLGKIINHYFNGV